MIPYNDVFVYKITSSLTYCNTQFFIKPYYISSSDFIINFGNNLRKELLLKYKYMLSSSSFLH